MASDFIIYIVFGEDETILKELRYALLSLKKVSKETTLRSLQVLIYTDRNIDSEMDQLDFNIQVINLSTKYVKDIIRRNNGYAFVIKAEILKLFFQDYPNGNVLLIDTDTFFIHDPEILFKKIRKGKPVMHLKEHKIHRRPVLKEYLNKKELIINTKQHVHIKEHIDVWNSGVIGINPDYAKQLDNVISLINQMCMDNKSHILEQLAFSYVLNQSGKIIGSDEYIIHYYFYKPFRLVIGNYFHQLTIGEKRDLEKIMEERSIPTTLQYEGLPTYLIQCIKYPKVWEWYFYCLPSNTFIGKKLRKVMWKDPQNYKQVIKTNVKTILRRNFIQEFSVDEVKMLRNTYNT